MRRHVVQSLRLMYPLLILAFLVAGIALAVAVFQYWVILFILTVIWSVLIVVTTRFLCDKLYRMALVKSRKPYSRRSRALSPQFPETPMPATPLIRVLETIDLSTMDVEQFIVNDASEHVSAQMPVVQEKRRGS